MPWSLRPGRTFAAYCYNAHAENRWLLASARRFRGLPGVPPITAVEEFVADPAWVDIYAVVDEWFLCAHGKGLKRIAPAAWVTLPLPLHSGQTVFEPVRAAPAPSHAAHISCRVMFSRTCVPLIACQKSIDNPYSRSDPFSGAADA